MSRIIYIRFLLYLCCSTLVQASLSFWSKNDEKSYLMIANTSKIEFNTVMDTKDNNRSSVVNSYKHYNLNMKNKFWNAMHYFKDLSLLKHFIQWFTHKNLQFYYNGMS